MNKSKIIKQFLGYTHQYGYNLRDMNGELATNEQIALWLSLMEIEQE